MSHTIEALSSISRKITVTVPAEEVTSALNAEARKLGASIALPGFRKGKAPVSTIIKNYKGEILSRAFEALIDSSMQKALSEEEGIRPISQPKLDIKEQLDFGKDFTYTAEFEILPEVSIPEDLSSLSVEMADATPTQEDIEALTQNILRSMATTEEVTEARLPENGDIVNISVDGDIEGKPVPEMKVEEYDIQLSEPKEGKELSELDKVIRGLHAGEEGNGSMPCPEDHPDESLRGKTIDLHVKLNKISRQILPALDEDFAKKVGFSNLDALKKMISEQAARNKAQAVRTEAERKLLDSALEGQEFELPEIIVKDQRSTQEAEVRDYLAQQGLTPEAVDESIKSMESDLDEQSKARARDFVFLTSLAIREKIEISDQELDIQIMQLAQQYKEDYRKLRETITSNGYINVIRNRMITAKAMSLMFDKATKTTAAPAAEAE